MIPKVSERLTLDLLPRIDRNESRDQSSNFDALSTLLQTRHHIYL
jgi:hypothetical protein